MSRSVRLREQIFSFQVWVPDGVASPLPAILFLHGAGESGSDNEAQIRLGLPNELQREPERWPFLVICPQKPDVEALWPAYSRLLNEILRAVEVEWSLDPTRRYLTGLSQGGNGTMELVRSLWWNFAAQVPVCGWGAPERLQAGAPVPMWAIHGEADNVIDCAWTVAAGSWRKRFGAETRLSLYPGVGHDAWTPGYREPDLPNWLLSHHL